MTDIAILYWKYTCTPKYQKCGIRHILSMLKGSAIREMIRGLSVEKLYLVSLVEMVSYMNVLPPVTKYVLSCKGLFKSVTPIS